jgi:selenide, water dikinase
LDSVLAGLPAQSDPNVLIGFNTSDDAGVYRLPAALAPSLALVQTVDFFTPIVDDPYVFGQVAAANSLSDVYAMGGRPITALAIIGFPNDGKDVDLLEQILQGGLAKMQEAACTVIGGHSIGDEEIKFGYAVTGLIDPNRILANSGARAGDALVLSKPLGTGIIGTAIKQRRASSVAESAAVVSMIALNKIAADVALKFRVSGATDVTGFGLLGHARELALASTVSLQIRSADVEFLPEAMDYAREGLIPGGLKRNKDFIGSCVAFNENVSETVRDLLFDPQTSGGLLFSVDGREAEQVVEVLRAQGVPARQIGSVIKKTHPLIHVV